MMDLEYSAVVQKYKEPKIICIIVKYAVPGYSEIQTPHQPGVFITPCSMQLSRRINLSDPWITGI